MFVFWTTALESQTAAHRGYQQAVQETFQEICFLNWLTGNLNATKMGKPNQWSSISDARERLSKTYGGSR
jgi:hypothetical protein